MSLEISISMQQRGNDGITLSWRDLSVWVKRRQSGKFWTATQYEHIRILNKVNGFVKPGTLTAIMGASGAGKTTLLATISQRIKGESVGEILINGRAVDKEMMSRISGFVPQEELVTKSLTVQEHMIFMARLKMDARVPETQRMRRLTSLLSDLGLTKCSHTSIYGLSGGEMKRLALAVQLLTDPPLLFCDEPTTGLDSYNAGIVIEKLRQFATRGKTVICTIHQPASGLFDMFHEVHLLAGGRVAFHGKVPEAAKHFDTLGLKCPVGFNQAEFYVSELAIVADKEEECQNKIQKLCDQYEESKYAAELRQRILDGTANVAKETTSAINSFDDVSVIEDKEFQKYTNVKKVNIFIQFYWLLWRFYIDTKRSSRHLLLEFGLYIFIAFLLAVPFIGIAENVDQKNIQNMEGLMYLIITETVFTFAYSVFHTFVREVPQLLREVGNGLYKPGPFYLAKVMLLIPQAIIQSITYTTIIFWIVGLHGGFVGYLAFCVPVMFSAIAATGYGCFMSASFESVATASLASVPIDFVTVIFSGVFLNLSNLPTHLYYLRFISPFYYGTEAVSILQWTQIDSIVCNNSPGFPCIKTGQQVLDRYGFQPTNLSLDLLGLFLYYIFYNAVGFLSFWRRSKRQAIY